MVADDLCLHTHRIDAKMLPEMHTKAQAVEKGAGAEHAIMARDFSRNIGEGVRRVTDSDQYCKRSRFHDLWNDVAIDRGVLFEKPQPPLRITAISGAPGFFVDPGRDQHHAGVIQGVVIAISDVDPRTKRCSITQVSRHRFRHLLRPVHEHDLASATARYGCKCDGVADISGANDAKLHWGSPCPNLLLTRMIAVKSYV